MGTYRQRLSIGRQTDNRQTDRQTQRETERGGEEGTIKEVSIKSQESANLGKSLQIFLTPVL